MDERMRQLHERLVTWWYGSLTEGTELEGIWEDAFRRFDLRLRAIVDEFPEQEERVLATAPEMLLECFESALDDFDHILATFPHDLPEGWLEWLPLPPEGDSPGT